MRIEIQWRSGAVECHTITLSDGGVVVDAKPVADGMWAIKAKSTYGGFVKHDVAPLRADSRRHYAMMLSRETISVEVDGMDFRGALLRSELGDRPPTAEERAAMASATSEAWR